MTEYDVVVVGGSLAGSTAAALLGRQGLRVALLEKSPSADHYKHLCTHELISAAKPVLERLGLLDALTSIGGGHESPHFWTRYGWVRPTAEPGGAPLEQGLNVRREKMDPLVRAVAAGTEGVDLFLGTTATELLTGPGRRPSGVIARAKDGTEHELRARLVVAADGGNSTVAKMAGIPARIRGHARFGHAAYYEGITLATGRTSQMWLQDPDVNYAFPTDSGLTLFALMRTRTPEAQAPFKEDLAGAFERSFEGLADAPDLSQGRRVGKILGAVHTPNKWRPAAAPGLAFVGDAAQVSDYLFGTGCGFALLSASWLADAVGPVLADGAPDRKIDRALARYRRQHLRRLGLHHLMISDYASARPFSPVERALYGGGVHDPAAARVLHEVAGRGRSPEQVLTPRALAGAALAFARHPKHPPEASTAATEATERSAALA